MPHRGTIAASTKEAAYDTLKAQGIKPGKVWEAPGIFNKVFGKGKRWIAILVLLVIALSSTYTVLRLTREVKELKQDVDDKSLYEDRGQLYGDPAVLSELMKDCWSSTFSDPGDRFLACYAIPCAFPSNVIEQADAVRALRSEMSRRISIGSDDLREVAQMKRMVNGMRREAEDYVSAGGTVALYLKKLEIRQRAEKELYDKAQKEYGKIRTTEEWKLKNQELRAKGLPMLPMGEVDF